MILENIKMEKIRAFIALDLPENALRQLEELIEELKKNNYPIRYYTRDNYHLTLKFLGAVHPNRLEIIKTSIQKALADTQPITLKFTTLGGSTPPRPGSAIWIETSGSIDSLTSLKKDLDKHLSKLGFKADTRFTAHITIGRFKKSSYREIKGAFQKLKSYQLGEEFDEIKLTSLSLIQSTLTPKGPIYKTLTQFPFTP